MKTILFFFILIFSLTATAQKIDSLFVNLYTDSLKKGTYNYINIDGLMTNGHYIPLDSTKISFTCEDAVFHGNSIFIPANFTKEKVKIKVALKADAKKCREFEMYVKKKEDPPLKSESEVMNELKKKRKKG